MSSDPFVALQLRRHRRSERPFRRSAFVSTLMQWVALSSLSICIDCRRSCRVTKGLLGIYIDNPFIARQLLSGPFTIGNCINAVVERKRSLDICIDNPFITWQFRRCRRKCRVARCNAMASTSTSAPTQLSSDYFASASAPMQMLRDPFTTRQLQSDERAARQLHRHRRKCNSSTAATRDPQRHHRPPLPMLSAVTTN
ncbi:hypothetical protein BHE74_00043743 [Ensete ventricosum]|nr:hypothetical protein BHE74_00043743 [Ensete ventricosum]RZS17281.1 hypothetical protein BHM03_00049410 [Ensete ventricosum]